MYQFKEATREVRNTQQPKNPPRNNRPPILVHGDNRLISESQRSKYGSRFYGSIKPKDGEAAAATTTAEEEKYDTKTIWGSDIVKYAVNQTNDLLALEDLLYDTGFLYVCPNTEKNAGEFETVVRNEDGLTVFYCQESENWSSPWWTIFECSTSDFGFRLFNTNFREVLSVTGRQCCYSQGIMEIKCGYYHLGTISEHSGKNQYIIKEPNGQGLIHLRRGSSKGQCDLFRSNDEVKIGEIRQSWPHTPIIPAKLILYGISTDLDLPTHQKHLILGSSFLLFYQKYRNWNNQRRCLYAASIKIIFLLLILAVIAVIVIFRK